MASLNSPLFTVGWCKNTNKSLQCLKKKKILLPKPNISGRPSEQRFDQRLDRVVLGCDKHTYIHTDIVSQNNNIF